jgi:hypothetical protein
MNCSRHVPFLVFLSSVALFSSKEKARLFLPYAEEKRSCSIVTSATGKLGDIDIEAVKNAVKDFQPAPSFALAQQ